MRVGIVIPAYNEERRIGRTLDSYTDFFSNSAHDVSILVVLNACTDGTKEIVKKFNKKKVSLIDLLPGGKGLAVVEGFRKMLEDNFDLIGFVDADMATPPQAYLDLIEKIQNNDGIIASRWVSGSEIRVKQTVLRKITSRGFNFIARSLFLMTYRDTQCGAKLFKKYALERTIKDLAITKWAFDIDLLYKLRKNGFRVIEVPTVWEDKKGAKLDLIKTPFEMFAGVIRLRLINSPFEFIVRFYDLLPEKIKIHHR